MLLYEPSPAWWAVVAPPGAVTTPAWAVITAASWAAVPAAPWAVVAPAAWAVITPATRWAAAMQTDKQHRTEEEGEEQHDH
jgi:hypothetical protein